MNIWETIKEESFWQNVIQGFLGLLAVLGIVYKIILPRFKDIDISLFEDKKTKTENEALKKKVSELSEIVNNQQKIIEEKQQFEDFFYKTPFPFVIANTTGMFLITNPYFCQAMGVPVGSLNGAQFLKMVEPKDIERTKDEMQTLRDGGDVVGFVNEYKGGFLIEWYCRGNGKVYGAAKITRIGSKHK